MLSDLLYEVKKECPLCRSSFFATQVRSSLTLEKQEADFNRVYKEINPLYNSVLFCPNCGYAAQDSFFDSLHSEQKRKLQRFLKNAQINTVFSGLRSREQAIELFKLSIYYAEKIDVANSRLAGLYLRLAWLYREAEDQTMEKLALLESLNYYEQALYKDSFPVGNMTEVTVEYLVALLYYQTGNTKRAINNLQLLLSSENLKEERRILRMARDLWYDIKKKNKEAFMDIDESTFIEEE